MNYELKSAKVQGTPQVVVENGQTTVTIFVNVEAGIAGDTYGFTRTTTEVFTIESDSMSYALGQIDVLAAAKVAELYPNT